MFFGIENILHNNYVIQYEYEEYYAKYFQSHKTLLWIWLMLFSYVDVKSN